MMLRKYIIAVVWLVATLQLQSQNSQVQQMVNNISGDSLFAVIAALQPMDRVAAHKDYTAVYYLALVMKQYDLDTVYLHHYSSSEVPNVVGIKYGKVHPDKYHVVGAHYDAVVAGAGADDNASGTAGVIDMLRASHGFDFEKSIVFVLFSAEETGLNGSRAFADSLCAVEDVEAMMNMDMIAYNPSWADTSVSVCVNNLSVNLLMNYKTNTAIYVPLLKVDVDSTSWVINASDHKPFWDNGVPALFMIETSDFNGPDWNPYYHTAADTIGTSANSPVLAEYITKSVAATLFEYASPIDYSGMKNVIVKNADNISLIPNPANNLVTIHSNTILSSEATVNIYTTNGMLVKSVKPNEQFPVTISLETIPAGYYIVNVIHRGNTTVKRLLIY